MSLTPLLLGLGAFLLSAPSDDSGAEPDGHQLVRGVTVSTPGRGRDWGSDDMVETLRQIRAVGGNWVTIHPYAGVSDGAGRRGLEEGLVRPWESIDPDQPPKHLVRPIREAHELGLKVLIKPHLAYWGTRFSWRGEIDFDSEEAYSRFFESYERWLLQLVLACPDADAFAVGTELDKTLGHEGEWRRIIKRVREQTGVPLTYAANWSDYKRVSFWDALDVVGIQAYFPITEQSTAQLSELRKGWKSLMQELRGYSDEIGRLIVFTEIGYNRSTQASVRPWEYRTEDSRQAERVQEACLRIALESIESEPAVVGSFLWKWFPGQRRRPRNFNLQEPRILKVVSESWGESE
jgi:hypothetical protein